MVLAKTHRYEARIAERSISLLGMKDGGKMDVQVGFSSLQTKIPSRLSDGILHTVDSGSIALYRAYEWKPLKPLKDGLAEAHSHKHSPPWLLCRTLSGLHAHQWWRPRASPEPFSVAVC